MSVKPETITELRINDLFTSLVFSEKNKDLDQDNIPMVRKHIVSTNTFLKKIKDNVIINNDILPLNCRYSKYFKNKSKLFIIEENPKIRTILVDYSLESIIEKLKLNNRLEEFGYVNFIKENKKPYKFYLSFPYVVYLIILNENNNVHHFEIFFRLSPITGQSDYLLLANLLNIAPDQKVCLGGDNDKIKYTMNEACENVIYNFWSSIFNMDYNGNLVDYAKQDSKISDYLTWMYYSKIDPMFIFDTPWIKYKHTLGEELEHIKIKERQSSNYLNFNKLKDSLINPIKTNQPREIMYENICESYAFTSGVLSVGDSFIFKNKEVFVNSFGGNELAESPLIIIAETVTGEVLKINISKINYNLINKQLSERGYIQSTKLKNGITVEKGDILKVDFPFASLYKKVKGIRKARDNKIEIKLNDAFYLVENLNAGLFDSSAPIKFDNITLKINEVYIIEDYTEGLLNIFYIKAEFLKLNVSKLDKINLKFKEVGKSNPVLNIGLEEKDRKLHKLDSLIKAPQIFRMGVNLFCNMNQMVFMTNTGYLYPQDYSYINNNPSIKEVFDFCVDSSGENLHIESFDINIDFKIGDSVVIANWKDPESMLIVHYIESFKYNEKNDTIEIYISDESKPIIFIKKENSNQDPIITNHGCVPRTSGSEHEEKLTTVIINIGYIRKIKSEHNGIIAGSKIKSKISRVSNFPKKDTNIIIGFFNDTQTLEPLVLCSNCCTLWFNDLISNFNIISKNSTNWNKFKHTQIDTLKIKFQGGDFTSAYNDNFPLNIIHNLRESNSLFKIDIADLNGKKYNYPYIVKNRDLVILQNNNLRHGFITPRYSKAQIAAFGYFSGSPNFYGSYTKNKLYISFVSLPIFFTGYKKENENV